MSDRQAHLMLMKEILDHLNDCHEQWQWADEVSSRYLAETMLRDLDECRRLCRSIEATQRLPRGSCPTLR